MKTDSPYEFKSKLKLFVWFMLGYGVFYIFPNFYAPWTPVKLHLTWIDRNVPFIPWTFLIYTSDYFLIFLAILIIQEKNHFLSFSRKMFATLVLCGFFFLVFPTTYPRPSYPLVSHWLIQSAMDLVYVADSPNNCFPSMHVALTSVSAWSLKDSYPRIFKVFAVWTLAIIFSTLTTKQHYFVDIVGGLSVLASVTYLEKKWFSKYFSRSQDRDRNVETSGFTKVF